MQKQQVPTVWKFTFGGIAGILACLVTHPFNTIKTCLQLTSKKLGNATISSVTIFIMKNYGVFGLYKGLTSNILRQCTYSSARFGIFNYGMDALKDSDGNPPNAGQKMLLGILAGGIGSIVGTPADIAMVRSAADACVSKAEGRNYTHVFNIWSRIITEEGYSVLFRGTMLNVVRGSVFNLSQLSTYYQAKQMLLATSKFNDDINLHLLCSLLASVVVTFTSIPIDSIKTRIQAMKNVDGKPEFKNAGDVLFQIVRREGPLFLWKGSIPYYAKTGPHTILSFIFLEQLTKMYFYYNP